MSEAQYIVLTILIGIAVIQITLYIIQWHNKRYPKYLRVYNYIVKTIAKEEAREGYYSITELRYKLMTKFNLDSKQSLECLQHSKDSTPDWFKYNIL